MREDREFFECFVDTDDYPNGLEEYLTELAEPGTYAGQDAIVAMARHLEAACVVWQVATPRFVIDGVDDGVDDAGVVKRPGGGRPTTTVHLAYHEWEHYSSVRSVDGGILGSPPELRAGTSDSDVHPETKRKPAATARDRKKAAKAAKQLAKIAARRGGSAASKSISGADDATVVAAADELGCLKL